mmetsp:Transcript_18766/g.22276  ORF Transcript_18766/g.22276 Transcript_18766/m.22276 type:complete len:204 (-) Transcript_18766:601-1212(-)
MRLTRDNLRASLTCFDEGISMTEPSASPDMIRASISLNSLTSRRAVGAGSLGREGAVGNLGALGSTTSIASERLNSLPSILNLAGTLGGTLATMSSLNSSAITSCFSLISAAASCWCIRRSRRVETQPSTFSCSASWTSHNLALNKSDSRRIGYREATCNLACSTILDTGGKYRFFSFRWRFSICSSTRSVFLGSSTPTSLAS